MVLDVPTVGCGYPRRMAEGRIDEDHVRRWIDAYVAAWRSNDRAGIEALFTVDATYRPRPDSPPATGRAAIADAWLGAADEPGTWQAELAPMLVHDDTAIITGSTDYTDGDRYVNLWVVRFGDGGRCAAFTEWWMLRRADA